MSNLAATCATLLRLRELEKSVVSLGSAPDHMFWNWGERWGHVGVRRHASGDISTYVTEYVPEIAQHVPVPEDPARREEFNIWRRSLQV
jgi:hypothetical protein